MQTQDRVGQQFGNYRLTRLIGKGGYAEVYLAEHVLLNNLQYAIKVLTGTNLREEQREEFLAEARTIANLQRLCAHIVQIYDFGIEGTEHNGIPYFVMEYATGGTLRKHYPREMPLDRIVFYVKQIAEALQCAHDQHPPIIHCDIKPENMLLRGPDHLLLSDFGVAMTGKTSSQKIPTKEMPVVGTATYIAPERFSKRTGRASDQYSLGIVVYEWLAGSPPFEGIDLEVCYKQIAEPPPDLYPTYPHVTPEIEDVVMRALKKKPEDRYPAVKAFAQAFEHALNSVLQRDQQGQQQLGSALNAQALPPQSQASQVMLPEDELTATRPTRPQAQPAVQAIQSQVIQHSAPSAPVPVEQSPIQPPAQSVAVPIPVPAQSVSVPLPVQVPSPQRLPLAMRPEVKQPPIHLNLPPSDPRQPHFSATTEPFTQRSITSSTASRRGRKGGVREFFELASFFDWDPNYSLFIYGGIISNVLSAFIVGLILRNPSIQLGGPILTFTLFALSVFAVERILAAFFAVLVAVYWLIAGWIIASFLFTSALHANAVLLIVFISIILCGTSLCLHIWYIAKRNI
jgi:serine/threonine protein kinase